MTGQNDGDQHPDTQREEIERTGRIGEVTGQPEAKPGEPAFGTPGTPAERVPPGLENDVA